MAAPDATDNGAAAAPPSKRRRLSPEVREAQIISAATTLIAERGFNGVSLQAVAVACGMTVPGLLHYVKSKDGLLIAVLAHRDEIDFRETGIAPRAKRDHTAREYLDRLVRRNAGQKEIVRLYSILNAESLNSDHPAHDYFTRRYVLSLQIIEDLLAEEYEDAARLARDSIAAMDGAQLQWLRFSDSVDLETLWREMADSLFAGADVHAVSK
ncbi:TetR/AcrR family transcriptional regulator [Microbacterium sp. HMH0099]|uniref:TetR/AcrR family transcriptional regulator n=1 Tax=Microbacterium sp. HMH0099 TaxID=3414026 RepID=UPI003BF63927